MLLLLHEPVFTTGPSRHHVHEPAQKTFAVLFASLHGLVHAAEALQAAV